MENITYVGQEPACLIFCFPTLSYLIPKSILVIMFLFIPVIIVQQSVTVSRKTTLHGNKGLEMHLAAGCAVYGGASANSYPPNIPESVQNSFCC